MTRDDSSRWERITELLGPIHGSALGTARRLAGSGEDGDDLFQEAVLRAHSRLDSLRDESSFRAWFFAILLSLHRSRCRRSFWRRFLPLGDVVAAGEGPAAPPEPGEDERWRARRASLALSRLPPESREAILLHDVEGFSVAEIAAMQGASLSAVKSRLSRGRARLRRFYVRHGWAPEARSVPKARLPRLASGEEV
jgi:RNA polymerase sigma-70 factor (ECF subfamily)